MKIIRDLIEYYIDECSYIKAPNFKQSNVDFIMPIPCKKKDIERILRVWAIPSIIYEKVENTPSGISLEGQKLTGKGMLIEGDLNIKIEYIACVDSQSTHTTDFTVPFCIYIVLPKNFNSNALVTSSILIEDININLLNERSIYCNVTLMGITDVC
ncbi:MAG: DUF3794 domain-containing protein [Sarcina sp.]